MASEFNTEAFTLLGIGVLVVVTREVSRVYMAGLKGLWLEYVAHLKSTVPAFADLALQ